MAIRGVRVGLLVLALSATVGGTTRAGQESGGDVTFRLILRGDAVTGDAFSLAVNASNGAIISPGIRCGAGSEGYNPKFIPCQTGTFEFVVEGREGLPIGTEFTYLWARITDAAAGEHEEIYTATVAVTEADQMFTVVYDYGGGSRLPNTSMRSAAHDGSIHPGAGMVAIAVLFLAVVGLRGRGRTAPAPRPRP